MEQKVHVEWGVMMTSCHITLMEGDDFGATLMISDDIFAAKAARVDATGVVPTLTKLDRKIVPIEQIRSALPPKGAIKWNTDEIKGDSLVGYELRGQGDGYRAWIMVRSEIKPPAKASPQQLQALLAKALGALSMFYPN